MRIAIVEDCVADQQQVTGLIHRYFAENMPDVKPLITLFDNAVSFLEHYRAVFDLVFLDIQMPLMNGMEAAEKLRRMDGQVPLVFITSMARYAVKGYDVDAVGFVLKPVQYEDFYLSMRRAVGQAASREGKTLTIPMKQGILRIPTCDIYFVEVCRHMLHFHTRQGIVSGSGNLLDVQKKLGNDFLLCNRSFLLNPRYIQQLQGSDVLMAGGETVPISRPKKKEFLGAFNHWLGEGNGR